MKKETYKHIKLPMSHLFKIDSFSKEEVNAISSENSFFENSNVEDNKLYILTVGDRTFLFEKRESDYIVGNPAKKDCVRLNVDGDSIHLERLKYFPDCSREPSMPRGIGTLSMLTGAVLCAYEMEGKRHKTVTLTDSSFIHGIKDPSNTSKNMRVIPATDYMMLLHGTSWYGLHFGAQPNEKTLARILNKNRSILSDSYESMPFDDFWRSLIKHPYIQERKQLIKDIYEKKEGSWMSLFNKIRNEIGIEFFAVNLNAIMTKLQLLSISDYDWVIPLANFQRKVDDLRLIIHHEDHVGGMNHSRRQYGRKTLKTWDLLWIQNV